TAILRSRALMVGPFQPNAPTAWIRNRWIRRLRTTAISTRLARSFLKGALNSKSLDMIYLPGLFGVPVDYPLCAFSKLSLLRYNVCRLYSFWWHHSQIAL